MAYSYEEKTQTLPLHTLCAVHAYNRIRLHHSKVGEEGEVGKGWGWVGGIAVRMHRDNLFRLDLKDAVESE